MMRICIPVNDDGTVDPRWGKAAKVALIDVDQHTIQHWEEIPVGWDVLHDEGPEGGHHARVARFLMDHQVSHVVANHMGPPMAHMLGQMHLKVAMGASGPARQAVQQAISEWA